MLAASFLFPPGRHGDIEDTLLHIFMARAVGGKKFDKMGVARVYVSTYRSPLPQFMFAGSFPLVLARLTSLPSSETGSATIPKPLTSAL